MNYVALAKVRSYGLKVKHDRVLGVVDTVLK
jgi:hypothetical protein